MAKSENTKKKVEVEIPHFTNESLAKFLSKLDDIGDESIEAWEDFISEEGEITLKGIEFVCVDTTFDDDGGMQRIFEVGKQLFAVNGISGGSWDCDSFDDETNPIEVKKVIKMEMVESVSYKAK